MYSKEIEDIKKFLRENIEIEKSLKLDDKKLRSQRRLQHIFFKRFSSKITQKLFEIVLTHSEKAERLYPGAGLQLLKQYSSNTSIDIQKKPGNLVELQKSICDRNFSPIISSILLECLTYCKPTSKVNVKKSINQKTYLEISNRYTFKADYLIHNKITSGSDAKVIIIDGYIENVSELHHIFQHFSTNEPTTPFLIFCRGMSDDVLNTISTNNQRGTFNCHPFKVFFDLENANTLVDIATVSGCDVVSSLKGDLISSIKISEIKSIDYFYRTNQGFSLKNSKNLSSIRNHISRLKIKSEETSEEAKKYLYQRIKSLSSNTIDIAIPDDINYFSHSQELDEGIRMIISFINKGPDLEGIVKDYHKKLKDTMESISVVLN